MPTESKSLTKLPSILVVGGAGYIGSHMVAYLRRAGFIPVILDNLSTGHQDAILDEKLVIGDITDAAFLDQIFASHHFAAVMHFASVIQVEESVKAPQKYYHNNVMGTLHLLNAMLKWKVNRFIFSSSAAVYGEPLYTPIDENHPVLPLNPYGHSKRMIEQMLEDYAHAYGLQFFSLRYFNAAGADPAGKLAERHEPETHLIPLVLRAAQDKTSITVFGRDYPTVDGTCVRDYIHVLDLCEAHLLALKTLIGGKQGGIYNLGTGQGYSVQQVIEIASCVTQRSISVLEGARRLGDPAILIADPKRAMRKLNWKPHYTELKKMIEDAWAMIRKPISP
ncbi:MAG: galE [Gammaproteobacteria bacterium]|jgi:UDP-glucose 4-epimerase|nr:galE [Gammaproteobacteria bacterium]